MHLLRRIAEAVLDALIPYREALRIQRSHSTRRDFDDLFDN